MTLPAEAMGSAPGRGVACADRDEGVEGGIARRRMSNQIVSNVSYPVTPGTTVLLSIDCHLAASGGQPPGAAQPGAALPDSNLLEAHRLRCAPDSEPPLQSTRSAGLEE